MRYAEFSPSDALAPFVRCVWLFESDGPGAPDRIVPDGRPELVVHYGAPYEERDGDGEWRRQPRALLAGQLTRPLQVRATGASGVVGLRFHPDGARGFAGLPMKELNDARTALDRWCAGAAEVMAAEVGRAPDDASRIALVQRFVESRIQGDTYRGDAVVRRGVQLIEQRHGDVSIEEIVSRERVGRRQVERRFVDAVGIGPALLAAIVRFRRVFDVIEHDSSRPWTEAAHEAGFYDQSHFIREFRRFVGCTPSDFERTRAGLGSALSRPSNSPAA